MLHERDLVEHDALGARLRALVVAAPTFLQPLERLSLTGRLAQRVAARVDLGVVAVEIELTGLAHELHPLQVGLVGCELVGAGGAGGGGGALRRERPGDLVAHRLQAVGAARASGERPGQLLLGEVLSTLTQRTQALEGKAERRHRPVVGGPAANWSDWTVVRAPQTGATSPRAPAAAAAQTARVTAARSPSPITYGGIT